MGEWVCELPMYLQQNMYSQSIIFSYVCRCGAFIFNQMVMTHFIPHIYGKKTFLPILLGNPKIRVEFLDRNIIQM